MGLDLNDGYRDLRQHINHEIECVSYGSLDPEPQNVALECVTCSCVLIDFDRPEEYGSGD
jgi:hypothetical protein